MGRRALTLCLLVIPAVGLGALGLAIVATAPPRLGAAGVGAPGRFALRQLVGLVAGAGLGTAASRLGTRRILAAAPYLFAAALVLTLAVFLPGVGVRAAGARRWVHLGPLSGGPAPFLIGALALLIAAARDPDARRLAVAGALLAAVAFVVEPDFSAAAIALAVSFVGLAGAGVDGRRLLPAAGLLLVVLAIGATRLKYVDARIQGFVAPQNDRRGKGFEVLALAHAKAAGATHRAGLGHGTARHRLSSPASDYAFALVGEELGRAGAFGVAAGWLALGAGIVLTLRAPAARRDPAIRALAAGLGTALVAPAALHVAVCQGWLPIIGVTMPLLSYDPALTVASAGELGLLAAIVLERGAPASRERVPA